MGHASERASTFEVDKAIAAIGYLVEQTHESMYSLLKMMYLADKLHLQRVGRFIAGERYSAMGQGPVPSNTYALFQYLRGDNTQREFEAAARYFDYRPEEDHSVSLRERPDYDELSVSELKCLATVVDTYRTYGKWGVRKLSHDDAWKETWATVFFSKSKPMDILSIARQFEDEALMRHLADPFPGEAKPSADLADA